MYFNFRFFLPISTIFFAMANLDLVNGQLDYEDGYLGGGRGLRRGGFIDDDGLGGGGPYPSSRRLDNGYDDETGFRGDQRLRHGGSLRHRHAYRLDHNGLGGLNGRRHGGLGQGLLGRLGSVLGLAGRRDRIEYL